MTRPPAEEVATYSSALAWLRTAWTTLPVPPTKLHTRDIDGVLGLAFSAPFARIANGQLGGWRTVQVQDVCYHPTLPRQRGELVGSPFDCGDCGGSGLHMVERQVSHHPMYVALGGLAKVPRRSDGTPAPIDYIMALAWSGWDLDNAAWLINMPIVSADHRLTVMADFLLAIRKLHSRYSSGPIPKSDPQRRAEDAA